MGLRIAGLEKRFDAVAAVDGVSLEVQPGEFFTLLGPSGCGKTTLLRLVAGILEVDAGSIVLKSTDITAKPIWARNIGLVFQNYALFPHLTVFQNVAFGLQMRRLPKSEVRKRVGEALEMVRLGGYGERKPAELSGGQQQRVALARAVVIRPDLLLLDEPLSNLDARLREEMRIELGDLQRRVGITTILVTHDIHEAFAVSERLAVMRSGRIEQIGTPGEVYARPANRFVANFVGPANEFEGRVVDIADGVARIDVGNLAIGAAAEAVAAASGPCWVLVRPEHVRIAASPLGLDNGFEGKVERVSFLGNLIDYRVRVGEAAIAAQTHGGNGAFREGDPVHVGWRAADCVAGPAA
jgi:putative spermidine/putrescine transport system ATP-binding protein